MKRLLVLLCLLPIAVWGVERNELDKMLAAAATNQSADYLVARNEIANLGTNVLDQLAQAGKDASLSWQQRLVARICYERLVRGKEVAALRTYDWQTHPGYDVKWKNYIIGPSARLGLIAIPYFAEKGLWYYYIELTWKRTGETPSTRDRRLVAAWPRWCRLALANQPEREYLILAMSDRLHNEPTFDNDDSVECYKELLKGKESEVVPVLIERYDAYNRREVIGPEMFPGRHAELYRGMFEPIVSFADSRHEDLLEKFIGDHPALAELKPKLAEVRARPAPSPKAEPPFRLGTNVVVVAQ